MPTPDDPVYLDHNATTPVPEAVREAMLPYLGEDFGNPSSGHAYGEAPAEAVAEARASLAALLGADPVEVVFTSGGTEANNWAIREGVRARRGRSGVVTTAVEHPSVARACERARSRAGADVARVGVDADGRVDPADVRDAVDGSTALASVMLAQNEVGTLQPVAEVADALAGEDVWVHTDASQAVGKVPVDVDDLAVDLLTVAGHKLGAPKGVGALFVRDGVDLPPFVVGAGQEAGRRAGTENVPHVAGLGAAARLARKRGPDPRDLRRTRDRLHQVLLDELGPDAVVLNGPEEGRLPNTLNVSFRGLRGPDLLDATPSVAASTGAACHDDVVEPSEVLLAMGRDPDLALGAVRLSAGHATTLEDAEAAGRALAASARDLGLEG